MRTGRWIPPQRRISPAHRLKNALIALASAVLMVPSAEQLGRAAREGAIALPLPGGMATAHAAGESQNFVIFVIAHLAVVAALALISFGAFREVTRSD